MSSGGTIMLGTVAIATEVAERKLKSLETELGRTVDRSQGLATALQHATAAVAQQTAALGGLNTQSESLSDRLGRIARNYNEVSEAMQRVVGFASGIATLIDESERHDRALRALGNSYGAVRRATNDAITAEQALAMQQRITQSGLRITGEELATFMRGAREHAIRTNGDVQQSVDQLTDALIGGEAEGLRRFGIALREGGTRAQAFEAALQRFHTQQRGTAPLARTAAESTSTWTRSMREAGSELLQLGGQILHAIPGLSQIIDWFANAASQARGFAAELRSLRQGEVFQGTSTGVAAWGAGIEEGDTGDRSANATRTLLRRGQETGVDVRGFRINELNADDRTQFVNEVDRLDRSLSGLGAAERATAFREGTARIRERFNQTAESRNASRVAARAEQSRTATTAAKAPRDTTPRRRGSGGGNDSAAEARREFERAFAEAMLSTEAVYNEDTQSFENATQYLNRTAGFRRRGESQQDFNRRRATSLDQFRDRSNEARRGIRDRIGEEDETRAREDREAVANQQRNRGETRRREGEDADVKDRTNAAFDETNTLLSRTREAWDLTSDHVTQSSQRLAQGVRGAFNTMSAAAGSHFQALITGRENIGEALQGMLHDTLTALATESFTKSLFETAQGFAAIATYRYPEAASHFTAAGIYAAVAAGAGVGAYVSRPQGASQSQAAGGGAGGRPSPAARGDSPVGSGGGNVTYVVNVSSALATSRDVQDELTRAESGAIRRGVVNAQGLRARQAAIT